MVVELYMTAYDMDVPLILWVVDCHLSIMLLFFFSTLF